MTINERQIATAMRMMAAEVPVSSPPARQMLARGVRRRHGRRALLTGTALGVAALAATTVPYLTPGHAPAGMPAVQSSAPGPGLDRLVLAAQHTSQTSFRFTMTGRETDRYSDGKVDPPGNSRYEGAWDPQGPKGFVRQIGPKTPYERRVIGTHWYLIKDGRAFLIPNIPDNGPALYVPSSGYPGLNNLSMSVDPRDQINEIRKLGTLTFAGRSNGVDRYTFSYLLTPTDRDEPRQIPVTGTIEVGVATGLISRITYSDVRDWHAPSLAVVTEDITWAYSGYGAPVEVTAP